MNTHKIGDISEHAFILRALELGFNVLKPTNSGLPYDLVLEKNNRFIKIQVKTAWKKKNGWSVNTTRVQTKKTVPYSVDDFNFAVAYIPQTKDFYIFPVEYFLSSKGRLTIGNNLKHDSFRNNWILISPP